MAQDIRESWDFLLSSWHHFINSDSWQAKPERTTLHTASLSTWEVCPSFPPTENMKYSLSSVLPSLLMAKSRTVKWKILWFFFTTWKRRLDALASCHKPSSGNPAVPTLEERVGKVGTQGDTETTLLWMSLTVFLLTSSALLPVLSSKSEHTNHTLQNIRAPWKKMQVKWGNVSATY